MNQTIQSASRELPRLSAIVQRFAVASLRRAFPFLLFVCLLPNRSQATVLGAGDLLFTGYHSNASTTDAFSFVLLVNISGTTTVNFTDNGWLSTNVFRAGEQTLTWTYTGTLVAGREITISGPSAGAATAILYGAGTTIGTCTGSMPSFATSGDQIIAYSGTAAAPTLIAGLHMNVYSTDLGQCGNTTNAAWDPTCITNNANFSVMPLGLSAGVSAIWIGTEGLGASEQDNGRFNCAGPLLTVAQARASITNSANWTANSVAPPDFTLPSTCAYLGVILPLNLLSFDGRSDASAISLSWKTSQEINHAYFDVEKSTDGRNFRAITRVGAQGGFSYLPFDYTYRDASPVRGANFYRLKMVGIDGDVKYSNVAKVMFGAGGRAFWISPNPASNEVIVFSASNTFTQVVISNMAGAVILQTRLTAENQKVDLRQIPAGQYTIRLIGAAETVTEKLLIAR